MTAWSHLLLLTAQDAPPSTVRSAVTLFMLVTLILLVLLVAVTLVLRRIRRGRRRAAANRPPATDAWTEAGRRVRPPGRGPRS